MNMFANVENDSNNKKIVFVSEKHLLKALLLGLLLLSVPSFCLRVG